MRLLGDSATTWSWFSLVVSYPHRQWQGMRLLWAPLWLLCLAVLVAAPCVASDDELEVRRFELQELQGRLQAVGRLIERFEAERQAEARELVRAERAVSAASRELRDLEASLERTDKLVIEHERRAEALGADIKAKLDELGGWLRRRYMHGSNEAAPLFAGRDPNQLARDLRYMGFLSEARSELIASLRRDHAALEVLRLATADERKRLAAMKAEHRTQQERLDERRRVRAQAVEKAAVKLREQQKLAEELQQSEAQLTEVIEVLARAAAARERFATLKAEGARLARDRNGEKQTPQVQPARRVAATASGKPFAELKNRLGSPVAGELIGRFGTPRASTGMRWRGTFIRATEGEQVVAVASGDVVFSDWLRGYGNLIIVDHGHDYLSIYGNNDALLREVGERVNEGDPIAMVGSAGWIQDSGLYFEIRHRGEPLDPAEWLARR